MPKNTPYSDLREAILTLEKEQVVRGQLLKDQIITTYESLKPYNLLKSTLSSFTESPEVKKSLLDILIAVATGLFRKKAFTESRGKTPLKRAGILLITGLNNYISRNPEVIRSIGYYLIDLIHKRKPSEK